MCALTPATLSVDCAIDGHDYSTSGTSTCNSSRNLKSADATASPTDLFSTPSLAVTAGQPFSADGARAVLLNHLS